MVNRHDSLEVIESVARGLREVRERVVFVGGAVICLYVDDPAADDVRPTYDVDLSLRLASYGEWARLQERLAELGFHPAPDAGVICRFRYQGLTVDVMPDDAAILGFTNPWYRPGLAQAVPFKVQPGLEIRLLPFPYALATKFAAWRSRGGPDPRLNHNFEDLIYLTDSRLNCVAEVQAADAAVRTYLRAQYAAINQHPQRAEIVGGHLSERTRLPLVLARVEALAAE